MHQYQIKEKKDEAGLLTLLYIFLNIIFYLFMPNFFSK